MPVKNLKQKKLQLRSKYKKIRQNMDKEKKQLLDTALYENFVNNIEYKQAKTILAFVSKDIEVDTTEIIKKAFNDNKTVAVPLCNTEEKLMDYYVINSFDDLEKGSYGLLEPIKERCKKITDFSSSVCMVPGLVYDQCGYRLGFGKGYYDRFLTDYHGVTVGVCYSRCIEQELPRGFYDKPIDLVITDKFTLDTRNM